MSELSSYKVSAATPLSFWASVPYAGTILESRGETGDSGISRPAPERAQPPVAQRSTSCAVWYSLDEGSEIAWYICIASRGLGGPVCGSILSFGYGMIVEVRFRASSVDRWNQRGERLTDRCAIVIIAQRKNIACCFGLCWGAWSVDLPARKSFGTHTHTTRPRSSNTKPENPQGLFVGSAGTGKLRCACSPQTGGVLGNISTPDTDTPGPRSALFHRTSTILC